MTKARRPFRAVAGAALGKAHLGVKVVQKAPVRLGAKAADGQRAGARQQRQRLQRAPRILARHGKGASLQKGAEVGEK